jgi:hypothetical protein
MRVRLACLFAVFGLGFAAGAGRAQDPAATTPPPASGSAAAAATPAAQPDQAAAAPTGTVAAPVAPVTAPTAPKPAQTKPVSAPAAKGGLFTKKEKEVYSGPTEIIVLDPTPMLDGEGKQRVDPEGRLMFNPPVKQQRDKKGHPLFDESKKPVFQTAHELGYDAQGHKMHEEKIKPAKMTPVTISRGTFTVDGIVGKAELNYDIPDLKYIYLFVPGIGVTVISNEAFPGAKAYPDAFNGSTLTVKSDEHALQISSDKPLLKDKKPQVAYVLVDRDFRLPSRYPVVGYGTVTKPPYQWPGSKVNGELAGTIAAPPVPVNLRPTILMQPCDKGQMRMPAPPVLPGQAVPEQPCVPIAKAQAAQAAMRAKAAQASMRSAAQTAATPAAATPITK